MTVATLEARIKSLEIQLAVMKAQVAHTSPSAEAPAPSFASLYGMLAGKASSSEEDVSRALYGLKWEGKTEP